MDNEIENVSDQLLGFMEEVNSDILKMLNNNPDLTYDQALKLAEIAVQDQRNDILWRRIKQISEMLDTNLCELNDNLYFSSDSSESED